MPNEYREVNFNFMPDADSDSVSDIIRLGLKRIAIEIRGNPDIPFGTALLEIADQVIGAWCEVRDIEGMTFKSGSEWKDIGHKEKDFFIEWEAAWNNERQYIDVGIRIEKYW